MNYCYDEFIVELKKINIEINEEQKIQFKEYYELLIYWNSKINLTAITEIDEVFKKHFLDSLSIAKYINLDQKIKVLDLGTGAGFPGIPLKIMFPDLDIVLADSLKKRLNFLDEVIGKLKLNKIKTVHGRAEDLGTNKEYREKFDLCVSRAVANLSLLSEYCLPFVKKGGKFISYKSDQVDNEVLEAKKAISTLGGNLEAVEKFNLANAEMGRSFIIISKKKNTPRQYPRKAGTPAKNPIK